MAIKTIYVHLANDKEHHKRLTISVELAKRFSAHISALFITNPVDIPTGIIGRGASSVVLEERRRVARKVSRNLKEEFSTIMQQAQLTWNWAEAEGDEDEILDNYAKISDLIIVSQCNVHHLEDHVRLMLQEKLVVTSGSPVLVIPQVHRDYGTEGSYDFGSHVLIPWRPERQAVRAVRDSLHFLQSAQKVTILTVDREDYVDNNSGGHVTGEQLVRYLSRHGVEASVRHVEKSGKTSTTILEQADILGCDLIVMGGYGRKKWKEVLTGSTTRYIFRKSKLPLFLSH